MREDYMEALERMFPKGFMIIHVRQDNEPEVSWFDPLHDPVFADLKELISAGFEDGEFN